MDAKELKTLKARMEMAIDCMEMAKMWLTLGVAVASKAEKTWFDDVLKEMVDDGEA